MMCVRLPQINLYGLKAAKLRIVLYFIRFSSQLSPGCGWGCRRSLVGGKEKCLRGSNPTKSIQRYMSSSNNAQSDHIQPFQGSDPSKLWLRNSPSVLRPRPYLGRAIQHAGKRQAKVEVFMWIDVIQSLIIWHRAACLNCKVDSYDSKLLKGLPFVAGFGLQVLLLQIVLIFQSYPP